jgi:hypothetical protein
MKIFVKLAVVLSILLLGTGAAFAVDPCGSGTFSDKCYQMTATDIDNPANSATFPAEVRLCNDGTGFVFTPAASGTLDIFWFSPPGAFAFSKQLIVPVDDECAGHFKFHGTNDNNVIGEGGCDGDRWTLKGHMVAFSFCE